MIEGPEAAAVARRPGVSLDGPPPLPSEATARPSLQQLSGQSADAQPSGGPQARVLEGLQMIERGSQLLAGGLPQMAPQLMQLVMGLRQAVPQMMAQEAGQAGAMPMSRPPEAVMS